jgi:KUP system potassium uptake protein
MVKVLQGGWVPLAMAVLVYAVMLIWRAGSLAVERQRRDAGASAHVLLHQIADGHFPRVPGTGVFLARSDFGSPSILAWHLKNNRALHESAFIFDVETASVPHVGHAAPIVVRELAPSVWRATIQFGFMERPNIPPVLEHLKAQGLAFDLGDITYYMAHELIVPREHGRGLPRMVEAIFAFLQRNCAPLTEYFHVPRDKVVEIGREFAI